MAELAPLPPEGDCSDELILKMDEAIRAMPMPMSDEEAIELLDVLSTSDRSSYYGAMWTLIHAVESAPGWPVPTVWGRNGPWVDNIRQRLANVGIMPPGGPENR